MSEGQRRSTVVPLRSGTLALFDPELMADRRRSPARWMRDPAAVAAEASRGRCLVIPVGDVPYVEVRVAVGAKGAEVPAESRPFETRGGAVFAGDLLELPSRAWSSRPWNLWDWLFVLFLACTAPMLWWLFGFDAKLLWVTAITSVVFLAMLAPISWAVFRDGSGFARRSGVPPVDRPEQLLPIPPGTWRAEAIRSPDGTLVEIRLS